MCTLNSLKRHMVVAFIIDILIIYYIYMYNVYTPMYVQYNYIYIKTNPRDEITNYSPVGGQWRTLLN